MVLGLGYQGLVERTNARWVERALHKAVWGALTPGRARVAGVWTGPTHAVR